MLARCCPLCAADFERNDLQGHIELVHIGKRRSDDCWNCGTPSCLFQGDNFTEIGNHCLDLNHDASAAYREKDRYLIRTLTEIQNRIRKLSSPTKKAQNDPSKPTTNVAEDSSKIQQTSSRLESQQTTSSSMAAADENGLSSSDTSAYALASTPIPRETVGKLVMKSEMNDTVPGVAGAGRDAGKTRNNLNQPPSSTDLPDPRTVAMNGGPTMMANDYHKQNLGIGQQQNNNGYQRFHQQPPSNAFDNVHPQQQQQSYHSNPSASNTYSSQDSLPHQTPHFPPPPSNSLHQQSTGPEMNQGNYPKPQTAYQQLYSDFKMGGGYNNNNNNNNNNNSNQFSGSSSSTMTGALRHHQPPNQMSTPYPHSSYLNNPPPAHIDLPPRPSFPPQYHQQTYEQYYRIPPPPPHHTNFPPPPIPHQNNNPNNLEGGGHHQNPSIIYQTPFHNNGGNYTVSTPFSLKRTLEPSSAQQAAFDASALKRPRPFQFVTVKTETNDGAHELNPSSSTTPEMEASRKKGTIEQQEEPIEEGKDPSFSPENRAELEGDAQTGCKNGSSSDWQSQAEEEPLLLVIEKSLSNTSHISTSNEKATAEEGQASAALVDTAPTNLHPIPLTLSPTNALSPTASSPSSAVGNLTTTPETKSGGSNMILDENKAKMNSGDFPSEQFEQQEEDIRSHKNSPNDQKRTAITKLCWKNLKRPPKCRTCSTVLKTRKWSIMNLIRHGERHSNESCIQCTVCQKSFTNTFSVKLHIQNSPGCSALLASIRFQNQDDVNKMVNIIQNAYPDIPTEELVAKYQQFVSPTMDVKNSATPGTLPAFSKGDSQSSNSEVVGGAGTEKNEKMGVSFGKEVEGGEGEGGEVDESRLLSITTTTVRSPSTGGGREADKETCHKCGDVINLLYNDRKSQKKFMKTRYASNHAEIHLDSNQFNCSLCSETFRTELALVEHSKLSHEIGQDGITWIIRSQESREKLIQNVLDCFPYFQLNKEKIKSLYTKYQIQNPKSAVGDPNKKTDALGNKVNLTAYGFDSMTVESIQSVSKVGNIFPQRLLKAGAAKAEGIGESCSKCKNGRSFNEFYAMAEHSEGHQIRNAFVCGSCKSSFAHSKSVQLHSSQNAKHQVYFATEQARDHLIAGFQSCFPSSVESQPALSSKIQQYYSTTPTLPIALMTTVKTNLNIDISKKTLTISPAIQPRPIVQSGHPKQKQSPKVFKGSMNNKNNEGTSQSEAVQLSSTNCSKQQTDLGSANFSPPHRPSPKAERMEVASEAETGNGKNNESPPQMESQSNQNPSASSLTSDSLYSVCSRCSMNVKVYKEKGGGTGSKSANAPAACHHVERHHSKVSFICDLCPDTTNQQSQTPYRTAVQVHEHSKVAHSDQPKPKISIQSEIAKGRLVSNVLQCFPTLTDSKWRLLKHYSKFPAKFKSL